MDKSYRQKVEVFTGCPSVVLDRTILSVIGGLVVGIALVILFSTMFPQGIVQNENNEFQVYRLMMADKTFTIPYRFLEGGDAKVTDFEVSLPAMSMTLSVEVLQDNTLEIHLPVEMLKEMENPTSYGYHVGDELVVFVDETANDAMWQHGEGEEIATIKLESGTETIEIAGTFPI
ncbi:MAG TPA: hypothetical protein VGQ13_01305 [Nitrososphaera sp.]|nr:hypothetical protein [Nitrososphaera sp.]